MLTKNASKLLLSPYNTADTMLYILYSLPHTTSIVRSLFQHDFYRGRFRFEFQRNPTAVMTSSLIALTFEDEMRSLCKMLSTVSRIVNFQQMLPIYNYYCHSTRQLIKKSKVWLRIGKYLGQAHSSQAARWNADC